MEQKSSAPKIAIAGGLVLMIMLPMLLLMSPLLILAGAAGEAQEHPITCDDSAGYDGNNPPENSPDEWDQPQGHWEDKQVDDGNGGTKTESVWVEDPQKHHYCGNTDGGGSVPGNFDGEGLPANGDIPAPCSGFNGELYGECTSWACYRSWKLGHPYPANMGNGNEVAPNLIALMGWIQDAMPNAGDVVSFSYNHVAIVEEVHQDGTFKISEYNHNGDHKGPYGREITDGCPGCTFAKWPG